MTIPYQITIGQHLSEIEKKQIQNIIDSVFYTIDHHFNNWNPESEISHLNKLVAFEKKSISKEMELFFFELQKIYEITDQLFDPTIAPLLSLWKSHLTQGKIPKEEDIKNKASFVGLQKLHVENGYFWKDHSEIALDLGGIAKGYCVDLLHEAFLSNSFFNFFVEWGGEVRTAGCHPDKRPWIVGIRHPSSHQTILFNLESQQGAFATSGDYYQYWKIEEKIFFHIIHPKTAFPLEKTHKSITSATVQAPSCLFADALATACMLLATKEKVEQWSLQLQKDYPNIKIWLAYEE